MSSLAVLCVAVTFLVWVSIFTTGTDPLSPGKRLLIAAAMAGVLMMPVPGTTPFYYLRGIFGDFSVTHALWALAALGNRLLARPVFVIAQSQKMSMALLLVAVAACFYPSALGATNIDLYRFGFEPRAMLVVLAVMAFMAWQMRQYFLLASIVTAVLAFRLQILESTNLWDYLFDPLLVMYCLAWLAATLLRFVVQRAMRPPQPVPAYIPVPASET